MYIYPFRKNRLKLIHTALKPPLLRLLMYYGYLFNTCGPLKRDKLRINSSSTDRNFI